MDDHSHDPLGQGGRPLVPRREDFDGPPMSTDEVERAMLADMAERMAEGDDAEDLEEQRKAELRSRPLMNELMWYGVGIFVLSAAISLYSVGTGSSGGVVWTGGLAAGVLLFLRGLGRPE